MENPRHQLWSCRDTGRILGLVAGFFNCRGSLRMARGYPSSNSLRRHQTQIDATELDSATISIQMNTMDEEFSVKNRQVR
jgi:hypothetical protein